MEDGRRYCNGSFEGRIIAYTTGNYKKKEVCKLQTSLVVVANQ